MLLSYCKKNAVHLLQGDYKLPYSMDVKRK